MSRKNQLNKFQTINNGDMSQSSITSSVTNIQYLDSIGIQLQWTGSPVGSLAIQLSADYAQDAQGNVTNSGNWTTMQSISTTGGSPVYVDITETSSPFIRVVYTKTSGTGTLNGFITAKMK